MASHPLFDARAAAASSSPTRASMPDMNVGSRRGPLPGAPPMPVSPSRGLGSHRARPDLDRTRSSRCRVRGEARQRRRRGGGRPRRPAGTAVPADGRQPHLSCERPGRETQDHDHERDCPVPMRAAEPLPSEAGSRIGLDGCSRSRGNVLGCVVGSRRVVGVRGSDLCLSFPRRWPVE